MGELVEKSLKYLAERRQRLLDGGINCIPSPFVRFRNDLPGIEQRQYTVLSSFTKGSKTQFASFFYIYQPLLWAYRHPETKIKVKILYFTLEEEKERIFERFESFVLFELSGHKTIVSPSELRSTLTPVSEDILNLLHTEEYMDLLNYYEDNVIFNTTDRNPTGVYYACKRYAEEHGTVYKKKSTYKDEFDRVKEIEAFDYYEQDDPNEYRIVIIDTVNLIDTERNLNKKQSIDKMSEYCALYLRNRYGFSVVSIQQQSVEGESTDSMKMNKIRPSKSGLADSKYTANDADLMIGIFSPIKFDLREYMGYDITKFKDNIRFIEIVTNRNGPMGGLCPLFFNGACTQFFELPRPEWKNEMDKVYKYLDDIRKKKQ